MPLQISQTPILNEKSAISFEKRRIEIEKGKRIFSKEEIEPPWENFLFEIRIPKRYLI